jgi:hypothetical protein
MYSFGKFILGSLCLISIVLLYISQNNCFNRGLQLRPFDEIWRPINSSYPNNCTDYECYPAICNHLVWDRGIARLNVKFLHEKTHHPSWIFLILFLSIIVVIDTIIFIMECIKYTNRSMMINFAKFIMGVICLSLLIYLFVSRNHYYVNCFQHGGLNLPIGENGRIIHSDYPISCSDYGCYDNICNHLLFDEQISNLSVSLLEPAGAKIKYDIFHPAWIVPFSLLIIETTIDTVFFIRDCKK